MLLLPVSRPLASTVVVRADFPFIVELCPRAGHRIAVGSRAVHRLNAPIRGVRVLRESRKAGS